MLVIAPLIKGFKEVLKCPSGIRWQKRHFEVVALDRGVKDDGLADAGANGGVPLPVIVGRDLGTLRISIGMRLDRACDCFSQAAVILGCRVTGCEKAWNDEENKSRCGKEIRGNKKGPALG